jgi:hypothetical protein
MREEDFEPIARSDELPEEYAGFRRKQAAADRADPTPAHKA